MEDIVLERMRSAIGWPAGTGDGIFAPGRIYQFHLTKIRTIENSSQKNSDRVYDRVQNREKS